MKMDFRKLTLFIMKTNSTCLIFSRRFGRCLPLEKKPPDSLRHLSADLVNNTLSFITVLLVSLLYSILGDLTNVVAGSQSATK